MSTELAMRPTPGLPHRLTAGYDPDGMPAKQMHLRLNAWEHEQLQRIARRLDTSLQRAARAIIRQHLLGEQSL